MKKIINEGKNVVEEMLFGMSVAHQDLLYNEEFYVISRKNKSKKVGVISGGGSGHEPAHAGYVGKGMLDAAVCGNVFSSPSPDRILYGIREANTGEGVLVIIKNYSGDVMNFQMAIEMAEEEGIKVKSVIVKDDVAVPDSTYSTGRRGIAGTVFVHKIAGALAEAGATLEEVTAIAEKTIKNIRSMGMAMTPCILPAVGTPGFSLKDDEIEIGMGIHGEPGVQRSKILSASDIANVLCERILSDYDYEGSEVAVLVNGLGATPIMELYILAGEVHNLLLSKNIRIFKYYVGNYMTSLEMSGCSLTLLKLDNELKTHLIAPTSVPLFM